MSSGIRRNPQEGVTLLETLVVLVIIAVMAGTMLQSASSVAARQDIEALTALAARLTTLSDIALASGSTIDLRLNSTPWTVDGASVANSPNQPSSLDWLQSTRADAYDVTDSEGNPVTEISFSPTPSQQKIFFTPRDTPVEGVAVVFDGLTARVMSGNQDD